MAMEQRLVRALNLVIEPDQLSGQCALGALGTMTRARARLFAGR